MSFHGSVGRADRMKVCVIGLGFVGLSTALSFSDKGEIVYGYDIDKERVDIVSKGQSPFFEPGIKEALTRCLNKTFFVKDHLSEFVLECEVIMLCVSSNSCEDGSVDLHAIFNVCDNLIELLPFNSDTTIVIKSTVPPGTLKYRITEKFTSVGRKDLAENLASVPEFLREGFAWHDVTEPDRIVVGTNSKISLERMNKLYEKYNVPIMAVTPNTAEFIKYLSNSLLATLISYSNEMAQFADQIGNIDVKDAFEILHMDKRLAGTGIAPYIYPGCGYGGYCLPKDTNALFYALGKPHSMLENVIRINESRVDYLADYIVSKTQPTEKIAMLGLSFKPDSDDLRESPALKMITTLQKKGRAVSCAYDPLVKSDNLKSFGISLMLAESAQEAICNSDVVIIMTSWTEFISLNYTSVKLFDCRYIINGI